MPDSRHVALTLEMSIKSPEGHLWIADTESDDSYQITGGITAQNEPAVSPDGRHIIYTEYKENLNITSISLSDGKPTNLIATEVNERMAAWSAKSEKLAYVTDRNGPMEIWMRSGDGSDQPLITQRDFPGNPTRFLMNPMLSPDGKRMIFTRGSYEGAIRTWITSFSGGAPELLSQSAADVEHAGAWSPDGRRFAELAASGSNQTLTLVTVGSRDKPVILRSRVNMLLPDWSPTGEWLTFNDDNGWNLISPDGKSTKQLGELHSAHLAFSKDGKHLFGIRRGQGPYKRTLFSLDVATLTVTDLRELGRDLAPATDYVPGIRLSLTPDGKSITYSTEVEKETLWLLEGFRQPGLLSRLGLNWSRVK